MNITLSQLNPPPVLTPASSKQLFQVFTKILYKCHASLILVTWSDDQPDFIFIRLWRLKLINQLIYISKEIKKECVTKRKALRLSLLSKILNLNANLSYERNKTRLRNFHSFLCQYGGQFWQVIQHACKRRRLYKQVIKAEEESTETAR